LLIQDGSPHLQEVMRMSQSPRHLLLFHKPLADHLVDRRLDEARRDRLAMAVAVPVIHDKVLVVVEVADELLKFGPRRQKMACHPSAMKVVDLPWSVDADAYVKLIIAKETRPFRSNARPVGLQGIPNRLAQTSEPCLNQDRLFVKRDRKNCWLSAVPYELHHVVI
jgi:hypothetical protein